MSSAARSTVLVAGSANLDFVVRAAHVPAPGETVLGHGFSTFPGGKGANQAVACARAGGATTRMLLALGEDDFAMPIEASLRDAGVDLSIVRDPALPTGTAFICLADSAENAITVAPGANLALGEQHLPALDGVDWLLLQLETPLPTVIAYARRARLAGLKVALNAAPAQALPDTLLALLDVLIVNEGELDVVAGHPPDLATGLARVPVPCVIVTLGARGCLARVNDTVLLQPGFRIDPTDTTAAGDTFCGALVAALADHQPMAEALLAATAASALACTRMGAQSSIPTRAEVLALLADPARVPDADAHAALAAACAR
ncbi:ribokinase [Stenotrophomonas sp. JAI102]|uniref:ribokinase n=1 Tax=Stenotrophomonas sp. JAI102 TaxID=2723077 RepID=UPI0015CEDE06|nr:ribokinase [Stenotrophomonas sp. JAI102]NYF35801.1 ribokinase [Stenotrophomonas sp. JAI102]